MVPSLAVVMFAVSTAHAQVNSGAVRGEVKDGSGGLVRGAQVTLTNQETGVSRTGVTNDSGIYLFPTVDPGTYTVTIIAPGFAKFAATGNIVTLGSTETVDATLQIGKESQTVEVVAGTLTLDTANVEAGQLYSEQQMQNLPTLGRNPFMLATYDSDVVTLGDPRYVRAEDSTGSAFRFRWPGRQAVPTPTMLTEFQSLPPPAARHS